MRRGALIVLEGLDRCGKTTQCGLLLERLRAVSTAEPQLLKFPDRETSTGKLIHGYLAEGQQVHDRAVHLLFSANRWEKSDMIREALLAGSCIVCDRYAYSGIAFSAAKGIPLEWCRQCDVGLPEPDLVLFLDMPPGASEKRASYGEERYERTDFQERVKDVFQELQQQEKERGCPWTIINADQSIEEVQRDINLAVDACLESCNQGKPVASLWSDESTPAP